MSRNHTLEQLLTLAKEREHNYDWVGASGVYEKGVQAALKHKDLLKGSEVAERVGFCRHMASFQAGSHEEFRDRIQNAIEAYETAHKLCEKLPEGQKAARVFHCNAVIKYFSHWLTPDPTEKRRILDECLELRAKALKLFSEAGEKEEYGRTYNGLSAAFYCRSILEWDNQRLKRLVKNELDWGQEAVAALSQTSNLSQIAEAYYTLATCLTFAWEFEYSTAQPEKIEDSRSTINEHMNKALQLAQTIDDALLMGWTHIWLGASVGGEEALQHFNEALECGKRTGDSWLTGASLDWLTYATYWKAMIAENPGNRRELAERAMEFYDQGERNYSILSFMSARNGFIGFPGGRAEHLLQLGMWETNPTKRATLFERAEKAALDALKVAEAADIPRVLSSVLHVISKTLEAQARAERASANKRKPLEKALKYRERAFEINERVARSPFDHWNLGVMQNYLATIKTELATIEAEPNRRRELLEEAVLNKEECLTQCNKTISYFESLGFLSYFAVLQGYQDTYATLLARLYDLTNDKEHLRKAIEISTKAIASAEKVDMSSLIAESSWRIAKSRDILGEYLEAAEDFRRASASYRKAAEKIPQLREFYQDYAAYTQAWTELEKAKHHHTKEQHKQANKHYDTAANLHESTKRWKYLAPNYRARAKLENAEHLSRREQIEEAKALFQETAELFRETKNSIKDQLEKIEHDDEKTMAAELLKASDSRVAYCLGRITVERAKILDRLGDHAASSKEYGSAAEKFRELLNTMGQESDREELVPIVYLCQAWQKMTWAEAEAYPESYLEAAQLFHKAVEQSSGAKARMLALGHSAFCRALDAGTRFEVSRDKALHSVATKHLETAALHYLRAGFKTAAEYAKATQRLLDGYVYVDDAIREPDLEKKSRYYAMAERVLQISAGSYMIAKHPEKRDQVQRLLEKIKEERRLVTSLREILNAPTIASSTSTFITPTQSRELAVGLERFEQADVQAIMILDTKEVRTGEDFTLEVQISNAGKKGVLLAGIDDVLLPNFDLVGKPDYCHSEDSFLDMRGKQLNPLKTEVIRLVLRSFEEGTFEIKPRVVCVDEGGRRVLCELNPAAVGISKVVLPGRITTGYNDLDTMLFGGVREHHAIALLAPSSDERDLLVRKFLEAGLKRDEVTFYVATEARGVSDLAEEFKSSFYLFLCHPHADRMIRNLPNVFKLKDVENLTDISVALIKAFRHLETLPSGPRRACISLVSDILLQHHAIQTRRWLSTLIPDLKSRNFTTLAIVNPKMHRTEELHALLGLFEGEIDVYEKETDRGLMRALRIRKMHNQRYLDKELLLRRERLHRD